jgi:hypothetical protein
MVYTLQISGIILLHEFRILRFYCKIVIYFCERAVEAITSLAFVLGNIQMKLPENINNLKVA